MGDPSIDNRIALYFDDICVIVCDTENDTLQVLEMSTCQHIKAKEKLKKISYDDKKALYQINSDYRSR